MMFPLFSILRLEPHFAKPPQQFILLHLKRHHLMDWVRAVISVTLGVKPKHDLPPMIMQQETNSVWTQIREPSEAVCEVHAWAGSNMYASVTETDPIASGPAMLLAHQRMIRQRDTNNAYTQIAWCLVPPHAVCFCYKGGMAQLLPRARCLGLRLCHWGHITHDIVARKGY